MTMFLTRPSSSSSSLPSSSRLGLATDVRVAFFIFGLIFSPLLVGGNEYCLSDLFNATCGELEVIIMTTAFHGRMRSGRCIRMEYDKERCQKDVLRYLDRVCSGRKTCSFPVASLRETAQVCHSDLSTYLEATYRCVKVFSATCFPSHFQSPLEYHKDHSFSSPEEFLILPTPDRHQHHSRIPALPARVGSENCPWQVRLDVRQKMRFTLYSFGADERLSPPLSSHSSSSCSASLVFEENHHVTHEKLCRGPGGRKWVVFTSISNVVSVYVKNNIMDTPAIFLLQYEAIGCGSIRGPPGSTVMYDEDAATIKCNKTHETWDFSCEGNKWIGEIGNCSENIIHDAMTRDGLPLLTFSYLPYGLATAVTIGVLLGIIVGSVPLGLAYAFLKRKWQKTSKDLLQSDMYDMQSAKIGGEPDDHHPGQSCPPHFFHNAQQRLVDTLDCDCYGAHYHHHHQTCISSQREILQHSINPQEITMPDRINKPDFPDIGMQQPMIVPSSAMEHYCEKNKFQEDKSQNSLPSRNESEKNIKLNSLPYDTAVYFDVQSPLPAINSASSNKERRYPDF